VAFSPDHVVADTPHWQIANTEAHSTMSLSFVSKAVQTSTDDGGFEEKPIAEGAADTEISSSSSLPYRPLFEQLRENQERDEEERLESQKAAMSGTLTLDDEDCAHLQNIQNQQLSLQQKRVQETNMEVAAFRSAQANRLIATQHSAAEILLETDSGNGNSSSHQTQNKPVGSTMATVSKQVKPPVVIRRRPTQNGNEGIAPSNHDIPAKDLVHNDAIQHLKEEEPCPAAKKHRSDASSANTPISASHDTIGGICNLLAGYDSD
jgi:FAM192A/Fyv6, N-terminal domain